MLNNTTHAPCLYHITLNDEFVLFLRLVNDFSIALRLEKTYTKLCDLLEKNWKVPMSQYSMMQHFKGIDISHSLTHVSIPSKTYLDKVFNNYGWNDITPISLPMNPSNEFICTLDSAEPLELTHHYWIDSNRFMYRAEIGTDVAHDHDVPWTVVSRRQTQSNFYQSSYNSLWCCIWHFPVSLWNVRWWAYTHSSKAIDLGPSSETHTSLISAHRSNWWTRS
jgi:hypothetical protein